MEQQQNLVRQKQESRIPLAIFSPPIFFPPEFLAIILLEDTWTGTRPRHWQNILNRNQEAVRLTTKSSRDVRVGKRGRKREKKNKVVTMRLTVDKKQFAARVAVEGTIEDSWRRDAGENRCEEL